IAARGAAAHRPRVDADDGRTEGEGLAHRGEPGPAEPHDAHVGLGVAFERGQLGPRPVVPDGRGRGHLAHWPRPTSTSFKTSGRSVMMPSTPRSSSRAISARSSMVHTWT